MLSSVDPPHRSSSLTLTSMGRLSSLFIAPSSHACPTACTCIYSKLQMNLRQLSLPVIVNTNFPSAHLPDKQTPPFSLSVTSPRFAPQVSPSPAHVGTHTHTGKQSQMPPKKTPPSSLRLCSVEYDMLADHSPCSGLAFHRS